ALMAILRGTLREEREELRDNNVRLQVIGRPGDLPAPVQREIEVTERFLASCTGMLLLLALSYSGRAELVDALRAIVAESPRVPLRASRLSPPDPLAPTASPARGPTASAPSAGSEATTNAAELPATAGKPTAKPSAWSLPLRIASGVLFVPLLVLLARAGGL